jgi:3-hydroxyisobutyrate dehydrogenase-like beta-hydroxyacid dehydrogenase
MSKSIGFIGLGLMGKPMALNLLKAGYPLTVWNRTPAKAEELVSKGAKLAANPREVAENSDILITIVSDPPALEDVLYQKGALAALKKGSTLIDSSTVSPDLARKVAADCEKHGIGFLDAPVTGGTWGAEKGELVFMVGGPTDLFEKLKPVFEVMGKRFFLLGPNGAGQTVKLAMNLLLALEVEALAEALALVGAAGIEGQKLVDVMQSSMGRAPLLDLKATLMLKHEYPASFPLRLMHKDVRLALALAKEKGIELPAGAAAYATYGAVKDKSNDDPDYASVARFWKQ